MFPTRVKKQFDLMHLKLLIIHLKFLSLFHLKLFTFISIEVLVHKSFIVLCRLGPILDFQMLFINIFKVISRNELFFLVVYILTFSKLHFFVDVIAGCQTQFFHLFSVWVIVGYQWEGRCQYGADKKTRNG